MTKKGIILLFALFISVSAFSQIAPNTYVIKFKDKNNSKYSIEKPKEFLSEAAVERRKKNNIAITEQDIPVNEEYINELKNLGFEIYAVSKWFNLAVVYSEDSTLYEKAKKMAFVDADYSTLPKVVKKKKAKNEKFKRIKAKETKGKRDVFDYGRGKNQAEMLNVDVLHSLGYTGKGMSLAVLDAGFYHLDKLPAFDSIRTNGQIKAVRDFVARDGEVYKDDTHGMMVLSCIAGNMPGELVGTCPHADFYLLRSEDEATEYIVEEYYWIAAAEYADSVGVDVLHASLGYNDFDDDIHSHTYEMMNGDSAPISIAADIAASKGILVVSSAGNEGNDPWHYVSAPADADSVLSVGAVSGIGSVSSFSSRGPTSDGRIKPDAMAQGSFAKVQGRSGEITSSSGTSFSGPILAGAVACLWQANPEFSNMEIIDAVRRTSSRALEPGEDYGYGIPNLALADAYLKAKSKERKEKQSAKRNANSEK